MLLRRGVDMKPSENSQRWLTTFSLSLIAIAGVMYLQNRLVPSGSLLVTAAGFLLWQRGLCWRDSRNGFRFDALWNIRRPHYWQIVFQAGVYLYWGLYWDVVRSWVLLILAQVAVAYLLEAMLSWSRHKTWRLGFGPWPIVGSINLFFWFREDFFFLQLLLIAGTQLTKEFITWNRDGRRVHVFNPSAIVTAVAGLSLMLTNRMDMAYGADLINSFVIAPNFFEVLLIVGLAVQFLFSTTLVTLGTTLSLSVIFFSLKSFGLAPQTPFDASVLIGFTLLITDPQTSPKNEIGKLLFGLCYGVGIFATYAILRSLQQPSFFDKILPVMLLNALVMQFDGAGNWIYGRFSNMYRTQQVLGNRYLHMATYALLFVAVLPSLKVRNPETFDPFPPVILVPSAPVQELLAKAIAVDIAYPDVRKPFGFRAEITHFDEHQKLNQDIAESNVRVGQGLLILGETDMAIARLERAAEEDPRYSGLLDEVRASVNR
jgi:hypothetical protein